MSGKYYLEYEALVYNMPACKELECFEHVFVTNMVTNELGKFILPEKDMMLAMNQVFLFCCTRDENNNNVYITLKNKIRKMEIVCTW